MTEAEKYFYMTTAINFGMLSHAQKAKVGAIAVKDDRIISLGRNGMPSGASNVCEYTDENGKLRTKPEVLHAETNMISKISRSTESSEGAIAFVSLSPCLDCAKMMYQAGIIGVYYNTKYTPKTGKCGISFLHDRGIPCIEFKVDHEEIFYEKTRNP